MGTFPGRAEIEEVLAAAGVLDIPPSELFEWRGGRSEDGTLTFPWVSFDEGFRSFIGVLSRTGFIRPFDWPSWQDEGFRLQTTPGALEGADLTDLVKLLTLHVRKDRFLEGHLAAALEDGWIAGIVLRLRAILDEADRSPEGARLLENRERL